MNNRMNKRVICWLCLVVAGAVFFCPPLFAEDEIHTVKSGETIYGLARKYNVKAEEILFINGIDDARKIQSGQKIRIPSGPSMLPPINPDPNAPSVLLHHVKKGETLFGIALQYGISLQDIRTVNNLTESYIIKEGEFLKIPVTEQTTVQNGTGNGPSIGGVSVPPNTAQHTVNLSLIWPIRPKKADYMTGKLSGVALVGEHGENVYCIFPGTVISAGPYRGFGRVVIVKSAEGYLYVYGGFENLFVKAGDYVTTGIELGQLGIDAVSGQAALFFMVYLNNSPVDPAVAPRK